MENDNEKQSEPGGDKELGTSEGSTPIHPSRAEVLDLLADAIEMAHKKIRGGRTKNADRDKLKIDWIKVLGYVSNIFLAGLKDQELEKLNERLKKLEERLLEKQGRQENLGNQQ